SKEIRVLKILSTSVVCFIHDDKIPVIRRQKLLLPLAAFGQVARREHDRMCVPRIVAINSWQFPFEYVVECSAVVSRNIEHEFLVKLFLPLNQHALGNQDQNAVGDARQHKLANREAGLNRLPKSDFITEHEAFGE